MNRRDRADLIPQKTVHKHNKKGIFTLHNLQTCIEMLKFENDAQSFILRIVADDRNADDCLQ